MMSDYTFVQVINSGNGFFFLSLQLILGSLEVFLFLIFFNLPRNIGTSLSSFIVMSNISVHMNVCFLIWVPKTLSAI